MKDVASTSSRQARSVAYPKKRPSPGGITKRGRSPPHPLAAQEHAPSRRAAAVKAEALAARKLRAAQVAKMHAEGIFLEEEYREEICQYMHEMEQTTLGCTASMDQQPEIKWHMRPCLVDFLMEVHFTFRLRPETLYLALNIIDRYVSKRVVYTRHYQLVGCAALWLAAKFEDAKDKVPTVQDLVSICRETYDESSFIQMERHVLETVSWSLGHPTAEAWLRIVLCGFHVEDKQTQDVARFVMEITLYYREFIRFAPSQIALGAVALARDICDQPRRVYEETEESLLIVEALDERLATSLNDLSETLVHKYSYQFYSKASTFVMHHYLKGGRFDRHAVALDLPVTPNRSPLSSVIRTPMSTTSSASDISDDMPATPTSPFSVDGFSMSEDISVSEGDFDKENLPSAFVIVKQATEPVPEQCLPHDFVTLARPALHALNSVSPPRVAAVS